MMYTRRNRPNMRTSRNYFRIYKANSIVEEGANKDDYHLQDGLLYKLDKLGVP